MTGVALLWLLGCGGGFVVPAGPTVDTGDPDTASDPDPDPDPDSGPDTDSDPDPDTGGMIFSPDAPYVAESAMRIKGIQPDWWADPAEIAGNNAGSVAMNLVWAHWQPAEAAPPCAAGQVAYDGACFTPDAATDAAIADWTARGLAVTTVVYGVPAWARVTRPCSPVAAGFEIFCAPDDAADYARFVGFLARRYNGYNGAGRVADFVVHNEVNTNTWFDVGCGQGTPCDADQWLAIYADNYVRAYDAAVAEQAFARVYVSLDHHFGSPDYDQPSAQDPLLAGQTVLRAVAAAAGSRAWRVAYHPYPPDLLAPGFSPDDWPRVTYGNLGTLVGWLAATWPGSAAATGVHLTESGVNSLAPSSEAAQADGVCTSLRNVLGTPGIGRYVYHRMVDHPDETAAGLGVGLWGSDGVAKAAWSTWALANRDDLSPPQLGCGFEDLPYTRLTRAWHPTRGHVATSRQLPDGFTAESSWRLHREAQADTELLYECKVGDHTFLTPDPGCEGQHPMGPVGWIARGAFDGGVALHRCHIPSSGDHFVSPDPACEGHTPERTLGWAWP